MKIQIISYKKIREQEFGGITTSTIKSPKSLDEFDINVIDLTSSEHLWCNDDYACSSINCINDFISLSSMVGNSKKTKVLYVFPPNMDFPYAYGVYDGKYQKHIWLKDCLDVVCKNILSKVLPMMVRGEFLAFENTRTTISGQIYEADFYFGMKTDGVTQSDLSEKITTIAWNDRIYGTTLNIVNSKEGLMNYLNFVFGKKDKAEVPDWISNIDFADDEQQRINIEQNQLVIAESQERIKTANEVLERNARYKSVLYTNSNELVEVVFEILERILGCDLSEFEDLRKEDFLIKLPDCTFIGEIKGVTSNIKYEHISQVELHYRGYLDRLEEEGKSENVKQILIMNPFRTKPVDKREPVCEDQVKLAERNGCLIIETITLLRVFEKFCNEEITTQKVIDVFSERVGLLSLDVFE